MDKPQEEKLGLEDIEETEGKPRLLRSGEFARLVGCTPRALQLAVAKNTFTPRKRDRSGRCWFGSDQVATYRTRFSKSRDTDEAAIIYRRLSKGETLRTIVIECGISANDVKRHARDWAALDGCVFLSGESVKRLLEVGPSIDLDGEKPEKDVIAVIGAAAEGVRCACKKRRAARCDACVRLRIISERTRAETVHKAMAEAADHDKKEALAALRKEHAVEMQAVLEESSKKVSKLRAEVEALRFENVRRRSETSPEMTSPPSAAEANALFDAMLPVLQEAATK